MKGPWRLAHWAGVADPRARPSRLSQTQPWAASCLLVKLADFADSPGPPLLIVVHLARLSCPILPDLCTHARSLATEASPFATGRNRPKTRRWSSVAPPLSIHRGYLISINHLYEGRRETRAESFIREAWDLHLWRKAFYSPETPQRSIFEKEGSAVFVRQQGAIGSW